MREKGRQQMVYQIKNSSSVDPEQQDPAILSVQPSKLDEQAKQKAATAKQKKQAGNSSDSNKKNQSQPEKKIISGTYVTNQLEFI